MVRNYLCEYHIGRENVFGEALIQTISPNIAIAKHSYYFCTTNYVSLCVGGFSLCNTMIIQFYVQCYINIVL